MTKDKEAQLFDQLYRNRLLREWLNEQLERQVEVLMINMEHAAVLKAQGAAGFIKHMLGRLDAAESAAKRQ